MVKSETQKKITQLKKQKDLVETYYKSIISNIYIDEPVDVLTFLSDPYYMGASTRNGQDIYDTWKEALVEMFKQQDKYIIVLTGSTGTGKSTVAIYALCYIQYQLMNLRDPWGTFGLGDSGKMAMSFFNLNKTLGHSR